MSGMALIWAANVKELNPAAKIVLIQLADFHNKETGQCNPSAQRLAEECEMSRATLFRHMTILEQSGLVTRHARGDGERGSNQYELHLDISLGPSSGSKGGDNGPNGVESQNETGGNVSKKRGKNLKGETGVVSNRDRNLTIETKKEPPSRKHEAVEAEKIPGVYGIRGSSPSAAVLSKLMGDL
ncbi:MAG: helix-turn-helix domain-containing protein [Sulfitobacter sp.]